MRNLLVKSKKVRIYCGVINKLIKKKMIIKYLLCLWKSKIIQRKSYKIINNGIKIVSK